MGLVVTIVLIVACYFLFRSFLTHLSRVPPSFDSVEPPRPAAGDADVVNRGDQES